MSDFIEIVNASENNLKNINLKLKHNQLIVITGLSGSGKTSLAFDTLFAEGQRRYVESLSSYVRQFLGKIKKPQVELIIGLPPAVAIEQKKLHANPRSTVGTVTEIYDYLRLLFARIGKTYSPISGKEVKKHTVDDVLEWIRTLPIETSLLILAPVKIEKNVKYTLEYLQKIGFRRVEINDGYQTYTHLIDDLLKNPDLSAIKKICLVIDRIKYNKDEDTIARLADSIQTAFIEGNGTCKIKAILDDNNSVIEEFSNLFEADGMSFIEPNENLLNFNSPLGSCPHCNGFGTTLDYSEDLVIPNKSLSVYDDAVACWKGDLLKWYKNEFIRKASKYNFPVFTPYEKLSDEQKHLLWHGNNEIIGIYKFFDILASEYHKIQNRILIARFRGKTICRHCNGSRLRQEASYIKINGKSIVDLLNIEIWELKNFIENIQLTEKELIIAKALLQELKNRIEYLCLVGLEYLTLNRPTNSLSGGEMQRVQLSTALGSNLVGALYVLDEPTVGLHPRDTDKLINILKKLRDNGNTVVVVEHERKIIENADWIVDLGPKAGSYGGQVVFQGTYQQLLKSNSITGLYLSSKYKVSLKRTYKKPSEKLGFIVVKNACHNNLKNINIKIPLGLIVAVTGVSGSGKSSLISEVVFPWIARQFQIYTNIIGKAENVYIENAQINGIFYVDQEPVGKSTRSNPATFIGVWDDIRNLFASLPASKINGFTPSHFSFNVDGGRCEDCKGEGTIKIDMQFMADVTIVCETCNGKRFKEDILEVYFNDKNIYDILEMTIDDSIAFFTNAAISSSQKNLIKLFNSILKKLKILSDVGLGYLKLGQSTSTLSGGENQRLKLASFILNDNENQKYIFIFDEPTTGLHMDDVNKLLNAIALLNDKGHSVIIIEHNLEVIKNADWIIDLGPDGGKNGGQIVFEGTPTEIIYCKNSYTGYYLQQIS